MAGSNGNPEVIATGTSEKKPRRERGSGRVFRKGNSACWYVQYYVNGRQVRESSGSDEENAAKKLLRKRIGETAAGIHRELRRLSYEDLRQAYFADYVTNRKKSLRFGKDGKPRLDPVTRLDGFFADYPASRIDTDLIRRFIADQQAKGKANATINRSIAALRRMFSIARKDGKIRHAPYFPMLKEAPPRKGVLKQDKYDALMAALPDYLRPVLVIGYHTGMRLGEILGLRWPQVDFLEHVIRLNAGETKNNEGRQVPITPELLAVLEQQYRVRPSGCDRVCHRDGERIRDLRRAWYTACESVGIGEITRANRHDRGKYRGFIPHDLRRTFITDAENAGAPRHEVMKGTGHKTESVYKRYAIGNPEGQKAAMDKVASYRAAQKVGASSGPERGFDEAKEAAVTALNVLKQ